MKVKNAYTESYLEVEPGDQFLFVIKAIVHHDGTYTCYRCEWQPGILSQNPKDIPEEDIPQGQKLFGDSIVNNIFPILSRAGLRRRNS